MKDALTRHIEMALEGLLGSQAEAMQSPAVNLEVPRQADHGDFSCNVAWVATALRVLGSPNGCSLCSLLLYAARRPVEKRRAGT